MNIKTLSYLEDEAEEICWEADFLDTSNSNNLVPESKHPGTVLKAAGSNL